MVSLTATGPKLSDDYEERLDEDECYFLTIYGLELRSIVGTDDCTLDMDVSRSRLAGCWSND